jgi:hypothetical protein
MTNRPEGWTCQCTPCRLRYEPEAWRKDTLRLIELVSRSKVLGQ